MSPLAPVLQAFFTDRLITQRDSSPRTIAAYRDTFRLLLGFAHEQTGKQPFELDIDHLDAPLIGAFLTHLERDRGNSARTRNARLGAIHSFYRYAALEHPEHAHTIARVMAIPTKRYERSIVCYLDDTEVTALLAAPDQATWLGRRDRALLALMIQTGVRVSELVGLRVRDVQLGTGRHVRVLGKGRKRRATPLTGEVATLLRAWITERGGQPDDPLFPTRQSGPLSRFTVGLLIGKHADTAALDCPSLKAKRITPHVLRHTAAMAWRTKGVDLATIALLLGHESVQTTQIYEHADPALKEQAIARTAPIGVKPGRYRPPDALLAFLEGL
ncbi:MAG: integrase/recombinase XerD [Mycobacterium sp.]|jgi:site-specific recombinase XerD|uniref:tyrosine-type recombinase/integrase n=1 Tax=Mycobacterium sp. TaxID=1785 RepID=UPI0028B9BB21|nr:integrase/recombinase XerD [Mycobacterium sp.]